MLQLIEHTLGTCTHIQFAEMALAHELTHPQGGPSSLYHTAEARLYMHKEQYSKAEDSLRKAITEDFQVPPSSCASWEDQHPFLKEI